MGNELTNKILKPTNPQRLGLALSQAVFNYEINRDVDRAREIAKKAFDEALGEIDQIEEENYKEASILMQLLKSNIDIWTENKNEEVKEEK